MGTNYYAKINICPTCKRPEETIHLGKSSGGWKFMFQLNGCKFYKNIKEMRKWLADKTIENEYGEQVSHLEFWDMAKDKQTGKRAGGTENGLIAIDGYDFYDRHFS